MKTRLLFLKTGVLALLLSRVAAQPVISVQLTNQFVLANSSNINFSVQVSDPGFLSYQWLFNGTNLPSANIITTVAGTNMPSSLGDGGAAANAKFQNPYGVAMDFAGNILIADTWHNRIRKVDTNGIITTIAGTNLPTSDLGSYTGDGGPAVNAMLNLPCGVVADRWGNIYIADAANARIRKVDASGIITTVVGNGTNGLSGDGGPGTNAEVRCFSSYPVGICVDQWSNLFFADNGNNRIRKLDTNGIISTVANGGNGGGLAMDASGALYFSDIYPANIVMKMDTNGVITVVAGGGTNLLDGIMATNAQMIPGGLCVDTNGNVFVGTLDNNRRFIRKVDTNGIITTLAGKGPIGYTGDGGPAANADIECPDSMTFDFQGNLLFADEGANVVRKVWLTGSPFLLLSTLSPGESGNYQVVATSSSGSVTSSIANLSIAYPPVSGVFSGTSFSLSCPVFRPSVLQVQWATNLTSSVWSNIDVINWPLTSNVVVRRTYPATNSSAGFYRVLWVQ